MSAGVDVLAWFDGEIESAKSLSADAYYVQQALRLHEARAAVAELIEAANRALPELASKAYADADDMGAHEALRAALARCGGAK